MSFFKQLWSFLFFFYALVLPFAVELLAQKQILYKSPWTLTMDLKSYTRLPQK